MNKKAKRRLVVVGGIVVIAMLVIVAIAGGGQAASSLSIGDVLGGGYEGTYDGALPATFGAGVVAVCTGTVTDGALDAAEMVTKCPSKYESAEGSLTVSGLLEQGDAMVGKDTRVCGYVRGEVASVDADHRFTIESQGAELKVRYDGGLDEGISDGVAVVVTGSLGEDGVFTASEQPAIDEAVSE